MNELANRSDRWLLCSCGSWKKNACQGLPGFAPVRRIALGALGLSVGGMRLCSQPRDSSLGDPILIKPIYIVAAISVGLGALQIDLPCLLRIPNIRCFPMNKASSYAPTMLKDWGPAGGSRLWFQYKARSAKAQVVHPRGSRLSLKTEISKVLTRGRLIN